MTREILFHGKRIDNDEWVEGCLITHGDDCFIMPEFGISCISEQKYKATDKLFTLFACEIDPETLGQYTGLNDRNSKWFFDGDIFRFEDDDGEHPIYKVQWLVSDNFCGWAYIDAAGHVDTFVSFIAERSEIIGNIHDNPELLEDKS